ncbi:methylated-DNA--[protein]-cysteine S-methyltransferase [Solirubrobacter phytolaccae]|uniref:methylated-DNA--[protein]-cysteine S-methyltransferase n=1 Tax=Solirubrobacter phytolaccae TaxID=1404360 RepID=A0A9X3N9W5_9ACTN|nr:methylated-DNA--[protein]-cysteine S-methyltransferase [Solirubrobacter phytolaccae]MDA0182086.1 methylated-DNA--[protein]-cysteine S-methyltransferase [Solirubrobacter phytolaccae]
MLRFETAIGECGLRWSEAGITRVYLPRMPSEAPAGEPPAFVREAVKAIAALFDGEPRDLREVVLDCSAVPEFHARVYAALREVGPGELCTYGDLARAVDAPNGAQAVGRAMGSNPFPIVVPCHRVLSSTGALHGFSAPGGIVTKRRMLEIERAPGFTQQSLFA